LARNLVTPLPWVASPRLGLRHLDEVEKGMAMAFNIVEVFHFEMFIFVINANCTLNVCTSFNDMVIESKCIYVFKMVHGEDGKNIGFTRSNFNIMCTSEASPSLLFKIQEIKIKTNYLTRNA
jgi:hypothetical protein